MVDDLMCRHFRKRIDHIPRTAFIQLCVGREAERQRELKTPNKCEYVLLNKSFYKEMMKRKGNAAEFILCTCHKFSLPSPVISDNSGIESILLGIPTAHSIVDDPKHLPPSTSLAHQRSSAVILTGIRSTSLEPCTQVLSGHRVAIGILMTTVTGGEAIDF